VTTQRSRVHGGPGTAARRLARRGPVGEHQDADHGWRSRAVLPQARAGAVVRQHQGRAAAGRLLVAEDEVHQEPDHRRRTRWRRRPARCPTRPQDARREDDGEHVDRRPRVQEGRRGAEARRPACGCWRRAAARCTSTPRGCCRRRRPPGRPRSSGARAQVAHHGALADEDADRPGDEERRDQAEQDVLRAYHFASDRLARRWLRSAARADRQEPERREHREHEASLARSFEMARRPPWRRGHSATPRCEPERASSALLQHLRGAREEPRDARGRASSRPRCPSRLSRTMPWARSTARCLETVVRSEPTSSVSSPTEHGPRERRSTISSRDSWARAFSTWACRRKRSSANTVVANTVVANTVVASTVLTDTVVATRHGSRSTFVDIARFHRHASACGDVAT
jgi:hypothetical protein